MASRRAGLALLPLLAGCLAPKHVRPDAPVDDDWPETPAGYELPAGPEADVPAHALGWREFVKDEQLQQLVSTALENNRDLRIALLRVDRARAQYNIQNLEYLPNLNLEVSATSSRQVFGPGIATSGTVYRVGLSVPAYELDLFGRLAHQSQAAMRNYLATAEGARAAQISLVSAVVTAWLAERSYAEQLELAERTTAARESALELTRQRFEAGIASELEVRQAESLVASARATAAGLARERARAEDALVLLVGAPVKGLAEAPSRLSTTTLVDVPAGLPSDLLAQRPDIRAAEERLRAANANIGAARAAFFPRITLTGSGGFASTELASLFSAGAGVWSFVPALVQPIFGIARNVANLKVAKIDRDIAVAEYEKAIQTAFREVADALVARGPIEAQVASLESLRDAEARRLELAQHRYREGLSSYLEVLDAERSLFDAERALVQARQLRLTNTVDLYAALGGGLLEYTAEETP